MLSRDNTYILDDLMKMSCNVDINIEKANIDRSKQYQMPDVFVVYFYILSRVKWQKSLSSLA